jgi:recombination protein RecA
MESTAPALDLSFSIAADVAVRRPPASATSFAIPGVRPASALDILPAPDMVHFGIPSLDALTGGVPRGALTEIVGPASSGRTSVMFALMAEITRRQEVCALVDVTDSFDPASAEAAGVDLKRTLWVRCGKVSSQESGVGSEEPRGESTPAVLNVWTQQKIATRQMALSANTEQNHQAITSGCFEAAQGRRELVSNFQKPQTIHNVAPPAKHISWSIHEDYDSRLRHAMVNGRGVRASWSVNREPYSSVKRAKPAAARSAGFADIRKAKWDRLDQALKATDLLLQSGGFGLVIIDLGDISSEQARRIPLTSWFRFRRAVESTPTILMVIAKDSCAKTCASLVMQLSANPCQSGEQMANTNRESSQAIHDLRVTHHASVTHIALLDGLDVHVELLRTRLERRPSRSAVANLETQTQWKKTG